MLDAQMADQLKVRKTMDDCDTPMCPTFSSKTQIANIALRMETAHRLFQQSMHEQDHSRLVTMPIFDLGVSSSRLVALYIEVLKAANLFGVKLDSLLDAYLEHKDSDTLSVYVNAAIVAQIVDGSRAIAKAKQAKVCACSGAEGAD